MSLIPSLHAVIALALTIGMFVSFARDRMPVEIVSLLTIAVVALVLYVVPMPGDEPTDGLVLAFAGFGHHALITICALMVMGRGLVVTGALDPAARLLERVWKINGRLGMLVSLLIAFGLSMMVNDTPVMVLLLPILVQLAARGVMPASKTLIPVNCAVLIGGMATTIGTSTNLLVVSIAQDLGLPPMSVFHFTPIVATAALVALPYLWLIAPRLLRDNSVTTALEKRRFTTLLRIGADSELTGRPLDDIRAGLPEDFAFAPGVEGPLLPGSRVRVSGTHEALEEAMRSLRGEVAPAWVLDRIRRESRERGEDVLVAELAVTADSRLVGLTLPTSGIGDAHSIAVLGVHRPERGAAHDHHDAEPSLREGDVLLAMGLRNRIGSFAAADGLLMLEGSRELPRRSKAVLALAIMGLAVGSASVGLLPIAIAALSGAIAMLLTGCVRFDRIGRALSAQVIVLVAASLAIGRFVMESGAAAWLGEIFSLGLQVLPPAGVLAAVMILVTILTNFASNATAATVGTPIAVSIASRLELPVEPLVLAVLFGCNLCYATPIAYQTNLLIMGEGSYRFADYLRSGIPLVLIMIVSLSFLLVRRYGM